MNIWLRSYNNNSLILATSQTTHCLYGRHFLFSLTLWKSIFKTRSFPRDSFHDFITCHIPVYKLMSVSRFHIHHSCQSKCGVQRESLLKKQNHRLYGFDWSERGESLVWNLLEVRAGWSRFFTVLISGWPAVFTSGPERGKWLPGTGSVFWCKAFWQYHT